MFLKKLKNFLGIKAKIFQVQAHDLVMCGYFCIGFIDFMLAGKKLVCFLHMILRKTMILFCLISKINEWNSIEAIDKTNLTNQAKFGLDEISKIKKLFPWRDWSKKVMQ